ncbi:hypothetical protein [Faucicola boevrei]|uniref:hypothetical protein n=1 Tax=Faucicola boevrei TaxID=346665 RepID=UPI0012E9FCEB|nr:hypothetical protein [Moraxella boevrei]
MSEIEFVLDNGTTFSPSHNDTQPIENHHYLYLAISDNGGFFTIGDTLNCGEVIQDLNRTKFAHYNDWTLVFSATFFEADKLVAYLKWFFEDELVFDDTFDVDIHKFLSKIFAHQIIEKFHNKEHINRFRVAKGWYLKYGNMIEVLNKESEQNLYQNWKNQYIQTHETTAELQTDINLPMQKIIDKQNLMYQELDLLKHKLANLINQPTKTVIVQETKEITEYKDNLNALYRYRRILVLEHQIKEIINIQENTDINLADKIDKLIDEKLSLIEFTDEHEQPKYFRFIMGLVVLMFILTVAYFLFKP